MDFAFARKVSFISKKPFENKRNITFTKTELHLDKHLCESVFSSKWLQLEMNAFHAATKEIKFMKISFSNYKKVTAF